MARLRSLSQVLRRRLMLVGAVSGLALSAGGLWLEQQLGLVGPRQLVTLDQQSTARQLETVVGRIESEGRELQSLLAEGTPPADLLRRTLEARIRHVAELNSLQVVLLDTATAARPPSVLYARRQGDDVVFRDLADDPYDVRGMAWFEEAMKAATPRWTSPFFSDAAGGIDVVSLHLPVRRGGGEPVALVGVEISVARLRQLNAETSALPVVPLAAYVADPQGRLLASSGEEARLAAEVPSLLARFGFASAVAVAGGVQVSSEGFALAHQPVPRLGWSIGAVFDGRELGLLGSGQVAAVLVGGTVLGMLLGWIGASVSRRPLRAMEAALARVETLSNEERPVAVAPAPHSREEARLQTAAADLGRLLAQTRVRIAAQDAERDSSRRELEVARQIQAAMLPGAQVFYGRRGRLALHGELRPARAVGGDFFGFRPLGPGHCAFFLGDVSDKGIPAALFMARVTTLLGALASETVDLELVLRRASEQLGLDNDFHQSATVVFGRVDLDRGELQVASAGHAPLLLRSADGTQRWCETARGPALGLAGHGDFPVLRLQLQDGDTLLAYTEGVASSIDARGEAFGTEGLQVAFERAGGKTLDRVARSILDEVRRFSGGAEAADDVSLLLMRYADAD